MWHCMYDDVTWRGGDYNLDSDAEEGEEVWHSMYDDVTLYVWWCDMARRWCAAHTRMLYLYEHSVYDDVT